jgi:hypothetical protein
MKTGACMEVYWKDASPHSYTIEFPDGSRKRYLASELKESLQRKDLILSNFKICSDGMIHEVGAYKGLAKHRTLRGESESIVDRVESILKERKLYYRLEYGAYITVADKNRNSIELKITMQGVRAELSLNSPIGYIKFSMITGRTDRDGLEVFWDCVEAAFSKYGGELLKEWT